MGRDSESGSEFVTTPSYKGPGLNKKAWGEGNGGGMSNKGVLGGKEAIGPLVADEWHVIRKAPIRRNESPDLELLGPRTVLDSWRASLPRARIYHLMIVLLSETQQCEKSFNNVRWMLSRQHCIVHDGKGKGALRCSEINELK